MAKYKIFISHSSKQKRIAEQIRDAIGGNFCFIDAYDFQPAEKTMDEIMRCLENTSIFVLLISSESLASDWVSKEICQCKDLLKSGDITKFAPYIVDATDIKDVPKWISDTCCYNLKPGMSVMHIINDIKKKLVERKRELSQFYRIEEDTFIGRAKQIQEFESKFYSENNKNTLIVSGRKGVGRHKFTREIVRRELQIANVMFIDFFMDSKQGIEDYIVMLNQQVLMYTDAQIEDRLNCGMEEKVQCAVNLTSEITKYKDFIRIMDHICIVRQNRRLADWFKSIIYHPDFPNSLVVFVISDYKPSPYTEEFNPKVLHINLPPFTKAEASSLFYSYAHQLNLDVISKDDATYFIEKLCATPGLLFKAVKAINDSGLRDAKHNINILVQEAERTLRTLIKEVVNNNQDMKDLIVLLATYELLSEPVLKDIFSDRIDEYNSNIDKLTTESLIYSFGPSEQYFILDNAIADYVRRARWELSKDIVDHVENVILHHIDGDGTLTGDVSMYLYSVKNQLLSGKVTNQNLLMPSVAIKAIISLYDSRKWENVVELSDKVLTESYYNRIDPEAVREIKYWLCLALCRLGNDRVKGEIINANFEQHDQEFLKGFWCRNTGQYEQAVKHYRKTIEIAGDINKAKRELVTSLLALRKYDEALDLAKSNYEKGSDNPYHIHAYFRCLVRQRHISPENHRVLQDLIEEMKNLENKKAESFYDSMVLEYNYRVDNHHQIISILQEADKLKRKWSKSNAVLRTVNEIYAERKIEALKFYTEDDFVE